MGGPALETVPRMTLLSGAPYRLTTLGSLGVKGEHGPLHGAATRRRPLALLALLGVAGETGISREKVLLYLWPHSNIAHARNSLYQTIHTVRRALHRTVIGMGPTAPLRLNRGVFSTDLWDFEALLTARALDEAIAIYRGPFLEGFSLPHLPEFDSWVAEQRVRVGRLYADALEAAADRATQRGHYRLAVERWQSLVALDPLSPRVTLGLLRALMAARDRPRALEYVRHYEVLLRGRLGTSLDPTIAKFVAQLREGTTLSAQPEVPGPAPLITTPHEAWRPGVKHSDTKPDAADQAEAVQALETADWEMARWERAANVFGAEALNEYRRAELLHRVGRAERADGPPGSFAEQTRRELALATAHLLDADVYMRTGDRLAAIEHYRAFLRMCQTADCALQSVVEHATRQLESLTGASVSLAVDTTRMRSARPG